MDEQKELQKSFEIQKAHSLIKVIMIVLDEWYPSSEINAINERAFKEKQYFRSKVMDCINNIARYIEEKDHV